MCLILFIRVDSVYLCSLELSKLVCKLAVSFPCWRLEFEGILLRVMPFYFKDPNRLGP